MPWAQMAAVLVIARLCEPASELHTAEQWYPRTALEDLLGVPTTVINDDRLYRALDHLLPHKVALQQHLVRRLGELFRLDYDLLLYDVTSTYFEGLAAANTLAARGHSRDHRPDCLQVCLALVVTRDGIPLGNRVDERIWVMDRGMTSADNIAWLQRTGRRYLIGTPRSELRRWSAALVDARDWQTVRPGVEVKVCSGPDGTETFLLCRSGERREKEQAMHARFAARIEAGLTRLADRLVRARRPLARGPLERQIGRLLERNHRAAGRYDIELVDDARCAAGLALRCATRPEWEDWGRHSEGCYVLRTNIHDWSAEALWQTYIQLSDAEAAFRIHKSELALRPIWHQRTDRVQAHILVCFLAYVLWKTLAQWQHQAGLGSAPRVLLDELRTIQSTDVASSRSRATPAANSGSAVSCGRRRRRRCSSIGWGSSCRSASR